MNHVTTHLMGIIFRNRHHSGSLSGRIELPSNRRAAKVVWNLGVQLWPDLK